MTNNPELVTGYSLAVLTPNVNEHKRLVQEVLGQDQSHLGENNGMKDKDAPQQLQMLAMQYGHCGILL